MNIFQIVFIHVTKVFNCGLEELIPKKGSLASVIHLVSSLGVMTGCHIAVTFLCDNFFTRIQ